MNTSEFRSETRLTQTFGIVEYSSKYRAASRHFTRAAASATAHQQDKGISDLLATRADELLRQLSTQFVVLSPSSTPEFLPYRFLNSVEEYRTKRSVVRYTGPSPTGRSSARVAIFFTNRLIGYTPVSASVAAAATLFDQQPPR